MDLDLVENLEHFENLEAFLGYLKLSGMDPQERLFVFVDEFQHSSQATKILKNLYDHYPRLKIYVSGSSSLVIANRLKESLAGRKSVYHLHPLDFEEFLVFKQEKSFLKYRQNWTPGLNLSPRENEKIWKILEEFLTFGGYPKVVLSPGKERKIRELRDIFNSYIKKDVKGLLGGGSISAYNKLLELLALNTGNLVNLFKFSAELSYSRETLEKHLSLLEETFVIKMIRPYFKNKKKEIVKMPKVYFEDLGIRNMILNNFNPLKLRFDSGAILENFLFGEMTKTNLLLLDLKFWRKKMGAEVDFVFSDSGKSIPIEAKSSKFSTTKLSLPTGLKSFLGEYHPRKAVVVNHNLSICKQIQEVVVEFIPFYFFSKIDWLNSSKKLPPKTR